MSIPVISVAQMRELEKVSWNSGVTEEVVMRRAGEAVARTAEVMTAPGERVLFLVGKGHNGDDAVFAHGFLAGRKAELVRVLDPEVGLRELEDQLRQRPALIVDGLFGIGLNRPLSGGWIRLIERVNESEVPVLAVDVPSGLSADSGLPLDVAVRATRTLTFAAVKQGLIKPGAAGFVGRLEVAEDIGLVPFPFSTDVNAISNIDFAGFPPARMVAGHKGTFGHLVIVAGSPGYHGAAVLASRGAQRAQPGLITLCAHEAVRLPIAAQLQSVMVYGGDEDIYLPDGTTAIVVGPGLAGSGARERYERKVRRLWQDSQLAMVVDASALDWLPEGPTPVDAVRVITPHPGEAARMLKLPSAEVQQERISALRELSRRWGNCHVVLKGHQTLVGRGREEVFVNLSGNPHLAQGGSGDLLAGYIGGWLAQPEMQRDVTRAVLFAVWQHGAAADALLERRPNFIVEELSAELGIARPTRGVSQCDK